MTAVPTRDYPHRLVISRSAIGGGTTGTTGGTPGTQDPDTGRIIPGDADVQDSGFSIPTDTEGRARFDADARAFLRPARGAVWNERAMPDVRPGDAATIYWNDDAGTVADAQVREVTRLDGSLWLERV